MPIKSMTGYGRSEASVAGQSCTIEVRSVNGRFLEVSTKLPKSLGHFEFAVRQRVKDTLSRGSVSVFVNLGSNNKESELGINRELIQRVLSAAKTIQQEFSVPGNLELSQIMALPDLFSADTLVHDAESTEKELLNTLSSALQALEIMRSQEGNNLAQDLRTRVEKLDQILAQIELLDPDRIINWKTKFQGRMKDLLGEAGLDPLRIAQEASILADKLDITEEITRFRSHNQLFVQTLAEPANQGKKLNFILQEMGREANTLGTKCQDAEIAKLAIILKDEIECIREQVQNIE